MVRKGARAAVVYCAPLGAETSRGAMFSSLMKPTTLSTMYGMKYIRGDAKITDDASFRPEDGRFSRVH